MNNEENKPSKDMMDMIKEHTDKACDMVIDHAIRIIRNHYIKNFVDPTIIDDLIGDLTNLKNKQQ